MSRAFPRPFVFGLIIATTALVAAGCSWFRSGPSETSQDWGAADQNAFYTTPQGSQLVRYDWYLALEQPGKTVPFNDDHLSRYGYLEYKENPDALPLGFVRDLDRQWLGLTCAACHTNEIRFSGKTWRIDGAPTDADTWTFLTDLQQALAETAADPNSDRFKRFASKVNARTPIAADALYKQLKPFSDYFTRAIMSKPPTEAWGRARIDAFGMIFNRATGIDLNEWENNIESPNAPVSVPFLWDTHWHDVVQWNGSAANTFAFQRLARNVGEVLGVFANTNIVNQQKPYLFFETTARRANLLQIEHLLSKLRSPEWPSEFGKIESSSTGAELYRNYCVNCHAITPRKEPLQRTRVSMTALDVIGTDNTMADNAINRKAHSGILTGVQIPAFGHKSEPLKAMETSVNVLVHVVIGAILAPPDLSTARAQLEQDQRNLLSKLTDEDSDTGGAGRNVSADVTEYAVQFMELMNEQTLKRQYKGRPLDGIWATAPYLHNGSVPNLNELLKPAKDRVTKFYVGTREFDPVNVGFVNRPEPGAFEFDTTKPGNSNAGHDCYLPGGRIDCTNPAAHVFTDDERKALVEYMKGL